MRKTFDFIIVGVGSMGSSAAYFLARRGFRVLGIDQFAPPHEAGSHTGQSRIIRKAYFEHPDYVPLLQRSYQLWQQLEFETNEKYYYETGIVYFGERNHPTMVGIRESSEMYHVPVTISSRSTARNLYPAFRIPEHFQTLVEPQAGFIRPELAIENYLSESKKFGATILTHEKVVAWHAAQHHVEVVTNNDTYLAEKVIFAAGSWTQKLIPSFKSQLKVTRQTLAWVSPKAPALFSLGDFPCWFVDDDDLGMYYGFPILPYEQFGGPIGLKIASHRPGEVVDPDNVERKTLETEEKNIRTILAKYLPDAGDEIVTLKTCLYTYSPDENFIIDILPDTHSREVIAAGFSGHGFKFVPVVGELLAELATTGKTTLPIDFLHINRLPK